MKDISSQSSALLYNEMDELSSNCPKYTFALLTIPVQTTEKTAFLTTLALATLILPGRISVYPWQWERE